MKANALPKRCRLCSKIAVERLFARNGREVHGCISYPLRAVWRINTSRTYGDEMQFMITVPKKKLRHAVDRVTMRRRIREAYRLQRHTCESNGVKVDLAFIYLADKLMPYDAISRSMTKILARIDSSKSSRDEQL